jgi:beta-galactosidase
MPLNNILSTSGRSILGKYPIKAGGRLLTFEELDQFSGFVLYESTLPTQFSRDPAELTVEKLRDRALVYVDEKLVGVLSRENVIKSLPLNKASAGKKLQILVENQGRINFQENFDFKGILGNVTLQVFDEPYYEEISDWTITGYPFEEYSQIESFIVSEAGSNFELPKNGWLKEGPVLFHGILKIDDGEEIADTWWHVKGWGKGSLFVNGFNLGRYWSIGPQMTMYIPKEHLNHGDNSIVVLELQKAPIEMEFNSSDFADFNE